MKQYLTLKLAQLDYLQNLQLNKLSYLVENSVSKSQNNSFYWKNKYKQIAQGNLDNYALNKKIEQKLSLMSQKQSVPKPIVEDKDLSNIKNGNNNESDKLRRKYYSKFFRDDFGLGDKYLEEDVNNEIDKSLKNDISHKKPKIKKNKRIPKVQNIITKRLKSKMKPEDFEPITYEEINKNE